MEKKHNCECPYRDQIIRKGVYGLQKEITHNRETNDALKNIKKSLRKSREKKRQT